MLELNQIKEALKNAPQDAEDQFVMARDFRLALAAQLGTCAYTLIERCLEEGAEPRDYRGQLIQTESVCFEVDDDMIDATTSFIKYVLKRLVELFPSVYEIERIEWIKTDTVPYAISVEAIKRGQLKL